MIKKDFDLLKKFSLSADGKTALKDLLQTLETKTGISETISAENSFLIATAHITGERAAMEQYITGAEEKAHKLLHIVLVEDRDHGASAIKTLKSSLSIN